MELVQAVALSMLASVGGAVEHWLNRYVVSLCADGLVIGYIVLAAVGRNTSYAVNLLNGEGRTND